ncbi:MAG: hypothetical protein J7J89_04855 [Thermoplasmata archaeon]|nr:hypothetical protein [Thermoplasmata archaeon]
MFLENRGLTSFLSGLGFTFLVPYICFFAWSKPVFIFTVVSGVVAGIMVPLLLFAFFNNHITAGFVSGMLVMIVVFLISSSFFQFGIQGVHTLIVSMVSSASVYLLLYSLRGRE